MNKICDKCGKELPPDYLYCDNPACRQADVKGLAFPPEGGQLMYIWGYRYPMLGFPHKEMLCSANDAKRALLELLVFCSKSYFFYFDLIFRRKKLLSNILTFMDRFYVADFKNKIQPLIDKNLLCQSAREFRKVLIACYGEHGWIDYLIGMYETDFAYRYRIQDIIGSVDVVALEENPAKEILELFDLVSRRDTDEAVSKKIKLLRRLVTPALFFSPAVKREIVKFFTLLDYEPIRLNTNDKYWLGKIGDFGYKFQDKTKQEWLEYANSLEVGWTEDKRPKKDEKK